VFSEYVFFAKKFVWNQNTKNNKNKSKSSTVFTQKNKYWRKFVTKKVNKKTAQKLLINCEKICKKENKHNNYYAEFLIVTENISTSIK